MLLKGATVNITHNLIHDLIKCMVIFNLQYAAACNVTDASGTVVKQRRCLSACGTRRGRQITYEGKDLTAYFCRPPHHNEAIYNHIRETFEDLMEMIQTWAAEGDEEAGNFWPFGGQWGSWWSAGGEEEDGGRPQRPPFGGRPGRSWRSVSGNRPERHSSVDKPPGGRPDRPSGPHFIDMV